jgi:hypothetical protein
LEADPELNACGNDSARQALPGVCEIDCDFENPMAVQLVKHHLES